MSSNSNGTNITEERENTPARELRNLVSIWDEYIGQYVCVQLKKPYFVITSPGHPCVQEYEDGSKGHINVTVIAGILGVKKDDFGNVRVTMQMKDPDDNKNTPVRADFDPALIDVVTVTPLESRIITPSN